jgi:hypothetical protein
LTVFLVFSRCIDELILLAISHSSIVHLVYHPLANSIFLSNQISISQHYLFLTITALATSNQPAEHGNFSTCENLLQNLNHIASLNYIQKNLKGGSEDINNNSIQDVFQYVNHIH